MNLLDTAYRRKHYFERFTGNKANGLLCHPETYEKIVDESVSLIKTGLEQTREGRLKVFGLTCILSRDMPEGEIAVLSIKGI